jgi:RNA polymerase sigma-70 factor (ECF subfamily)
LKKSRTNTDSDLIRGLKKDNHDSFQKLFDHYSQILFQFSLSYLKSREVAEEVVQEVFIKIWDNRNKLRTDTSFKSYLFTIALNSIRKSFNKQSRQNKLEHDILLESSDNAQGLDDNPDYQMLLDKLDEFIQLMPEKRRQVFIKKKIEGKSLKEIAKELSITTKTVEYHIAEGMKFLKKKFGQFKINGMFFFFFFFIIKNDI